MPKAQDLLQGTLDMLILKAVSLGPLHGYGVLLRIQQISGERLQIQQGSLYPALYRLEHQGLIKSEWGESDNKRKAKYYALTAAGPAPLPGTDPELGTDGRHHRDGAEGVAGRAMSAWSRLRSWLGLATNRAGDRPGAPRRVAVPHRAARRRPRARGRDRRRGPSPGPRGVRQPRRAPRREPRRRRPAPVRRPARRPALRLPPAPPVADVHRRGRAVARPRHRRELGDVQPDGGRALEVAAGSGAASTAAGRLGVWPQGGLQLALGQRVADRHRRVHEHVDLLPRVRGDAARRRVAGGPPVRVQADWPAHGRHRRQRGARELRPGLRRLLSIDWRAARWRAAPSCRPTIDATPTARSPSSARRSGRGASGAIARSSARRFASTRCRSPSSA